MRTKPAVGPPLLQRGQRDADQVGAVGGVQPGVVALRLDVGDVGAVDEPGDAAELDRDLLVVVGRPARPAPAVDHPAHRLGEPLGAHRLEDVVDGPQVEGLDGVLLVGGDEHDRRRRAKRASTWASRAREPGHLDVEEDRVDVGSCSTRSASVAESLVQHLADPRVAAEQVGELVERRRLVVDDEDLQRAARCGRSCVHSRGELRHPHDHLGAGAGRGLHDQAVLVAERVAQPLVDVAQPDRVERRRRRRARGVPAPGPRRRRRPPPRSRTLVRGRGRRS